MKTLRLFVLNAKKKTHLVQLVQIGQLSVSWALILNQSILIYYSKWKSHPPCDGIENPKVPTQLLKLRWKSSAIEYAIMNHTSSCTNSIINLNSTIFLYSFFLFYHFDSVPLHVDFIQKPMCKLHVWREHYHRENLYSTYIFEDITISPTNCLVPQIY